MQDTAVHEAARIPHLFSLFSFPFFIPARKLEHLSFHSFDALWQTIAKTKMKVDPVIALWSSTISA